MRLLVRLSGIFVLMVIIAYNSPWSLIIVDNIIFVNLFVSGLL